jgi:hypothetical protein
MAVKTVSVNYTPTGVKADPDPVEVKRGDSIMFHKGPDSPPNGKVRVTFAEPKFFSRGVFNDGEDSVQVTSDLPHEVEYQCDLMVEGQLIPQVKGSRGGGIKPGSGQ